jgi:hypothetical protein
MKPRVLVGCERSGRVREAFKAAGWEAWSCDLEPSDIPGQHLVGDVRQFLFDGWELGIFFPPCTRLCLSGVRWLHERSLWRELAQAADLFRDCWEAPIPKICVENPTMHRHARRLIGPPPSQAVQPFWFGDPYPKRTCLWLKGLPKLEPTRRVKPTENRIHGASPGPRRAYLRSLTPPGLAQAMAEQFGNLT